MTVEAIAILYPGDMGHAVGKALGDHGYRILTCLAGRGEGSRARAERARMAVVGDLAALVAESDLILSILPPEAALATARDVAAAMQRAGRTPAYADCNAIAPETSRTIGEAIGQAGAAYIDGGIVGQAPGKSDLATRFYVSGPHAALMAQLDGKGIDVRVCGERIGDASAVKMCYGAVSKGTNTLYTAALMAAEALGVGEIVRDEWAYSAPGVYERMKTNVPRLPADSARWVGEMEEIARTFASVGVTPKFHEGAAAVFRLLAATPFADETRETMDRGRTVEEAVAEYVRHLERREAAE